MRRSEAQRVPNAAEMVLVPASEFSMGSDDGARGEKPRHRIHLDAFYIDKVPLTNALYERFLRATSRKTPSYRADANFNGPSQPVVGVTWHDADAYCRWAGKRLPTEAEWEKTARGTDGRKYPWGDQWESSRANSRNHGKTTAVGSYPSGASPYGALDMAGNVRQWVADWYDANYYNTSPNRNPQGPTSGEKKVHRGAPWSINPNSAFIFRAATRNADSPDVWSNVIGFRCARGQ